MAKLYLYAIRFWHLDFYLKSLSQFCTKSAFFRLSLANTSDSELPLNTQLAGSPNPIHSREGGKLAFLDVDITNDYNGRYKFQVHRKDAITNVQVKPNSSISPTTAVGVFKGFIARAKAICSEEFLSQEIDFLIEMFVQNGHDRTTFSQVAAKYLNGASKKLQDAEGSNQLQDAEGSKPVVKIPWIPIVSPKLRRVMRKHGVKVIFTSGKNLKDILCRHKCPLPKNSNPNIFGW